MPNAKKQLSQADLKSALEKINALHVNFQKELAALKAARIKIIDRINKKADDKKIQEIIQKIK